MGNKGFDCGSDCTSHGQQIIDDGYSFIVRYTCSGIPKNKTRLSHDEAIHLSRMGIYLVNVFENDPTSAAYFSSERGVKDGTNAADYAQHVLGQPKGTPIYFTVDYDATIHDLDARIVPYFHGVKAVMDAVGYSVGVYGSGLVCRRLKRLASFTWLAQSRGWAESREKRDYNLVQHDTISFHGMSIDPDESNGNGGGWLVK